MDPELKEYLDQGFGKIDQRFDKVDHRFEMVDLHVKSIDERVGRIQDHTSGLEQRLSLLDRRFSTLDQRVSSMELRYSSLDQRVGEVGHQVQKLGADVDQRLDKLETEVRGAYVLIEDVRKEVRVVAEGVLGVSQQLKEQRAEFSEKLGDVESLTRRSYEDLDSRVRGLKSSG